MTQLPENLNIRPTKTTKKTSPIGDTTCPLRQLSYGPKRWKVELGPFWWSDDTGDYGKWRAVYDFLLVFNSNHSSICHRYGDNHDVNFWRSRSFLGMGFPIGAL